jgi:hypothetical protein
LVQSSASEQPLVFPMIPNPEPDDGVTLKNAQNAVVTAHACRIDRLLLIHPLKTQAWMIGMLLPYRVGLPCLLLHFLRKTA